MGEDHYAVLGVRTDADYATIRAAYLQQMQAVHPDRRPGDPAAAEAARRLNAAFRVLKDHRTRADYDRAQVAAAQHNGQRPNSGAPTPKARPAGRHDLSIAAKAEVPGAKHAEAHYRAFQMWCLRVAVGLVALGLLLLLTIGG